MFRDLTDEEIKEWKKQIYTFMRMNTGVASIAIPGTGVTIDYQNAWKVLDELKKEEDRRSGKRDKFLQLDMRNY